MSALKLKCCSIFLLISPNSTNWASDSVGAVARAGGPAGDARLAAHPIGLDPHLVRALRDGVGGKQHAGGVRVDHELDHAGDQAPIMRAVLLVADKRRARRPQRRPTFTNFLY